MNANPILLQKKYSRVIECFAKRQGLSLDAALDFFYRSETYTLIRGAGGRSPVSRPKIKIAFCTKKEVCFLQIRYGKSGGVLV